MGSSIYNYDASGNLTHAEEFDYQGTIWEYTWDTRNQVIRAAGWGSEAITDYRYNFAGHRYYNHVSGGSWEYFGLDDGVRTGLFGQATPGPIWNILTPSGRVIGRNPYNGAPSYYVTDHLGSTRVVVSSNGSIQEAYDYYPFGLPMPGRSITGWSETPERFTGYYKDQESYLYYAQARMYDPAIGRFMSVDPHASNYPHLSPYVYVANNPLIFVDPDGRDYVLHFDEENKTVTVAANYYTTEAGAKSAQANVDIWNEQSGQHTYTVDGVEYTVNFDLKFQVVDQADIAGLVANDPGGNSWEVVPDGSLGENVLGGITGGNRIKVSETYSRDLVVGGHEIGHSLGMPHDHNNRGIMADSYDNASMSITRGNVFFMMDYPLRGRQLQVQNRHGNIIPLGRGTISHGTDPRRR